jgi:nicotinate-nucleotide adenylyltransferase
MSQRIGLLGGTFNPIHHGHLIVARSVAETLDLDRLVFIPSANPPHKSGDRLAGAEHRLAMARLAVEGEAGFDVDDLEIRREGPSYTILTVEQYRDRLAAGDEFFWIIGSDTLSELSAWYRIGELVDMCRFVTAVRPGAEDPDLSSLADLLPLPRVQQLREDILETPRIDISSSDIRRRVADGRSIRYLVPPAVSAYIGRHHLYEA